MAFLRSTADIDAEAEIHGREVFLRHPAMGDYSAWAELRAHEPAASDRLGAAMGARRADALGLPPAPAPVSARADARTRATPSSSSGRRTPALLGGLSISNVRRGVAQAASVGYWIGAPHVRPRPHDRCRARPCCPSPSSRSGCIGWRRHACRTTCPPRACCEKVGFKREGMARRYLKINGVWQDHDLFALLHDDARA